MAKKKFYTVWKGKQAGVYSSWAECEAQVKGVADAKFKGFSTQAEAIKALEQEYTQHIQISQKKNSEGHEETIEPLMEVSPDPIWNSISVDAACSGNPGVMEYRGVDTKTGQEIFRKKFELGTNNIGEFLALVHALALFSVSNPKLPIYTDSKTAMAWVRSKKCKTTFSSPEIDELVDRAIKWLKTHDTSNPILKWDTKTWGEIPADFGRK